VLRLRLASAAVLVPLLVAVVWAGRPWLTILLAAVAALAAREVFDLLRRAGFAVRPWLGIGAALLFVGLDALYAPFGNDLSFVAVGLVVVVAAIVSFTDQDPRQGFLTWVATSFGVVYVGLVAFMVRILAVAPELPPTAPLAGFLDGGRVWLLILVLGVWTYDTTAYAAGRLIGRGRFLAHISPSKTWSGVLGGALGAVIVSAVLVSASGGPLVGGLLLGGLISAGAQAGDVAESMLKRAAGAKDSGRLIPGHGGILDRVDSFLFAAPAVYLYLTLAPPVA
jgi:phosphatidate cytidylyltransferase